MPRWSASGQSASLPAPMARLPLSRSWVAVGPPLSCKGPRSGSVLGRSVGSVRLHVSSSSRLCPRDLTAPEQAPPDRLLATTVLMRVTTTEPGSLAYSEFEMPPPLPKDTELLLTVLFTGLGRDRWQELGRNRRLTDGVLHRNCQPKTLVYGLLPTGNSLQLEPLSRQSDIHGPPLPFVAPKIMNQRTVTCGLLGVEFLTGRYLP